MKKSLTHFGVTDASNLMCGFHQVGTKILKDLLEIYSAPLDRKTLRTWKMKDATTLIGRSESYLRKIETTHPELKPETINKVRHYTLEKINRIRNIAGTRYLRHESSDPIIIAVSNFKGGVAKSTTALHLAQKCAIDGLKVLCIDLDPQATLTLGFGYIPDIDLSPKDTIKDALVKSPELIKNIISKTYFDGISIIPGNLGLSELELLLTDIKTQKKVISSLGMPDQRLLNALNIVKHNYDVIILDCGPNLGMLTINAATASNALLVPVPPMMSDLGSFVTFTGTLASLFEESSKSFDFFRILLTKHPESRESRNIQNIMNEAFGNYMLTNHIVNSVEKQKASATFGSAYEMPRASSKSYKRAIQSLDKVLTEIIDAFKLIWEEQSKDALVKNLSTKKELVSYA